MSRTTTTTGTAPQAGKAAQSTAAQQQTQMSQACLPMDKVAARAFDKWLKGGCKHGNDKKDWLEAEAEIKAELTKVAKK